MEFYLFADNFNTVSYLYTWDHHLLNGDPTITKVECYFSLFRPLKHSIIVVMCD